MISIIDAYGGDVHKRCPICDMPFENHLPWELLDCNDIFNGKTAHDYKEELELGYKQCDNVEHDWIQFNDHGRLIKWCNTCKVPIRQYHGQEAVEKAREVARMFR